MNAIERDRRAGFSLAELMVVAVIGGLVVLLVFQLLVTNQRSYTAQAARVSQTQSIRAGMDVLFAELREISLEGGDILSASGNSLQVRAPRAFGVVCAINDYASQDVIVRTFGTDFAEDDSVFVFADNDITQSRDDVWVKGTVSTVAANNCPSGQAGQRISFGGMAAAWTNDSVRVSAPVRSFEIFTYSFSDWNDEPYLVRQAPGESAIPLAGPLAEDDGLDFIYYDVDGNTTTTEADINEIEIILRTVSEARGPDGTPVSDSLSIRVRSRN